MDKKIEAVIASISTWNEIKRDKAKVLSLWEQCSSFKVLLPVKSDCKEKFHIYFGVQIDKQSLANVVVMHLISDYNDQVERIKNFKNADDYIYSVVLENRLSESAEIDEVVAKARVLAWQNSEILKNYLDKNDAFDVYTIGKEDFLEKNGYEAYFGMKSDKTSATNYTPDMIIHNISPDLNTSYYDLARTCPPYTEENVFGLQELSYQGI